MNVLFFYPSSHKDDAGQVLGILRDSRSKIAQVSLDVFDENSPALFVEEKNYAAIIIFYTSELERSGNLFEIVRYIERNNPPGRFIFLPETGGERIIPPGFHLIRSQLHRLFYYPAAGQPASLLEAQLGPFKSAWQEFTAPAPMDKPGSGKGAPKAVPFWPTLIASIFIIILAGLITVIIPSGLRFLPAQPPTPTPIRPPAATAFWLQESFQSIDSSTRWQVQHYYSGRQPIQTSFSGELLRLSAVPVVTEAVYQLDSRQSWPLDEFQSLSFTFALSGMADPAAKNALAFGLYLNEDNSYRLECLILPAETDGRIQCQIKSPTETDALSEPIQLALDTSHSASLVFDPDTYTFQFFLDDTFYGQREIQSVAAWRGRTFNLQVMERLQNLSSASYHCDLDELNLAHQP